MLSLLGLLGRAVLRICACAFAAVLEAKELEKALGRHGFRILTSVENVNLQSILGVMCADLPDQDRFSPFQFWVGGQKAPASSLLGKRTG